MSRHLVDTYRANELLGQALTHAVDAAAMSYDVGHVSVHNQGWEEDAEKNLKVIRRIHESVVECMRYYVSFAEACGRPLARQHSRGEDRLCFEEGDWRKVHIASGMIHTALRTVNQELRGSVQSDFTRGNPLTNEVASVEDQAVQRSLIEGAFAEVQEQLSEIKLIGSYFSNINGPASGDRSETIFPQIQAKFLGPQKAR